MHALVIVATAVLILTGLVGSVVPVLPGPALVLAGALLYAWYGDFAVVGWATLGVLAALTALGLVLDYAASLVGARACGAGGWGIAGACIGACAGFVVANMPGALIGLFLGACVFELGRGRTVRASFKIGFGTVAGFLAGTLGKVVITLVMIAVFVAQLV